MSALVPGFLVMLGLIVAIGAQNVFVLRQGARREHVVLVVVLCVVSDAILVGVGVAGLGEVVTRSPSLLLPARWGGAIFLAGYGLLAARRALLAPSAAPDLDPSRADVDPGEGTVMVRPATRRLAVAATTLALTWLNPHVYLDTVVLIGSLAATHGPDRWWFALGSMLGSVVWFIGLGMGARYLGRRLRTAAAWRAVDGFVAATMLVLAAVLVMSA